MLLFSILILLFRTFLLTGDIQVEIIIQINITTPVQIEQRLKLLFKVYNYRKENNQLQLLLLLFRKTLFCFLLSCLIPSYN